MTPPYLPRSALLFAVIYSVGTLAAFTNTSSIALVSSTSSSSTSTSPTSFGSTTTSSLISTITTPPSSSAVSQSLGWITSGTDATIPGIVTAYCSGYDLDTGAIDLAPCEAVCEDANSICISAARSIVSTCSPQWDAYNNASSSWAQIHRTSSTYTTVEVMTFTETYTNYPSSLTDYDYTVTGYTGNTFNPVYLLGDPTPSTSVDYFTFTQTIKGNLPFTTVISVEKPNFEDGVTATQTITNTFPITKGYPEQTPVCSYTHYQTQTCGGCTIGGGSVQVFYWPSSKASASGTASSHKNNTSTPLVTAVVSGITMTSPSVYVSVQTVFAQNYCSNVGGNYSGSILTMDPASVSTVYGAGGQGYVPNFAAQFNFNDLQGLVPASVYEENSNCARFGCEYIYNADYRPTLAIPPQIRSLDPKWSSCDLGLNGFYDPPSALTAASTAAGITLPGGGSTTTTSDGSVATTSADPASTQSSNQAPQTSVQAQSDNLPTSSAQVPASTSQQNTQPQSTVQNTQPQQSTQQQQQQSAGQQTQQQQSTSQQTQQQQSTSQQTQEQQSSSQRTQQQQTSGQQTQAQQSATQQTQQQAQSSADPAKASTTTTSVGVGGVIASIIGLTSTTPTTTTNTLPSLTLSAGQATTISGTTISLASAGSSTLTVVNGVTQSATLTTAVNSAVSVASGVSLSVGQATTLAGGSTTISLGTVSGGSTIVIVNGQTSTVSTASGVSVASGVTLSVGQATTVSGQTLSVGTVNGGTTVVVSNGQTSTVKSTPSTPIGANAAVGRRAAGRAVLGIMGAGLIAGLAAL